jgi:hypothetical protein
MNYRSSFIHLLSILAVSAVASGCATITSSETQPITVMTRTNDGQTLENADCLLKNESGAWQLTTPGVVSVRRSSRDLMVECKKDGHPNGFARAISRAAGGMWGNIIFGGGIGAIIDHNKGTGYNYPNDLVVKMGSSTTIDRHDQKNPEEKENNGEDARAGNPAPRENQTPSGQVTATTAEEPPKTAEQ